VARAAAAPAAWSAFEATQFPRHSPSLDKYATVELTVLPSNLPTLFEHSLSSHFFFEVFFFSVNF
jgi:hypothetical protein